MFEKSTSKSGTFTSTAYTCLNENIYFCVSNLLLFIFFLTEWNGIDSNLI